MKRTAAGKPYWAGSAVVYTLGSQNRRFAHATMATVGANAVSLIGSDVYLHGSGEVYRIAQ